MCSIFWALCQISLLIQTVNYFTPSDHFQHSSGLHYPCSKGDVIHASQYLASKSSSNMSQGLNCASGVVQVVWQLRCWAYLAMKMTLWLSLDCCMESAARHQSSDIVSRASQKLRIPPSLCLLTAEICCPQQHSQSASAHHALYDK